MGTILIHQPFPLLLQVLSESVPEFHLGPFRLYQILIK